MDVPSILESHPAIAPPCGLRRRLRSCRVLAYPCILGRGYLRGPRGHLFGGPRNRYRLKFTGWPRRKQPQNGPLWPGRHLLTPRGDENKIATWSGLKSTYHVRAIAQKPPSLLHFGGFW